MTKQNTLDSVSCLHSRRSHPLTPADLQHEMLSLIIQSLYRAPIKSPKTVIDIATGTGIWATEFGISTHPTSYTQLTRPAKQHPDSTVIGTDINTVNNPPSVPNLSYKLHDAEKDSWETLAPVDYIHARFVVTCFDDAPKVVSSMFNSLSSGGWLEFQDICFETHDPDGSVKGTLLDKYIDMLNEAGAAVDRDIHKPKRYAEWMRQAGFVDVQEVIIPFPGNTWTKDERQKKIGELMIRNMVMGQRSLSGMLTQKWSEEELKDVKDNLVEASANPKMHSYWEL